MRRFLQDDLQHTTIKVVHHGYSIGLNLCVRVQTGPRFHEQHERLVIKDNYLALFRNRIHRTLIHACND